MYIYRGVQMLQKSRNLLKILGARRVIWTKFHTEYSQIIGATVQILVATANWLPKFVHRSFRTLC